MEPTPLRRARGAFVSVLLGLAACSGGDEEEAAPATTAPPPTVVVAEVAVETVPIVREFVARTEARETVSIQARVEAILESMHFEEGLPVEKDQVLYRLDPRTYDANLASAEASLARAEADLDLAEQQVSVRSAEAALEQAKATFEKAEQDVARLRPLAEKDAVPRQDLDAALANEKVARSEVDAQEANLRNSKIQEEVGILQARANVQKEQANVELARLELDYCTVRSPLAGLIGRTEIDVGNLVGRGEATELATVSSIDPILVTMSISEEEFLIYQEMSQNDQTESNAALELILADNSVYPEPGRFITAERAVELETGTLQVVSEFPNPDGHLRPGQFGRVRAVVALRENGVLVPQRAVMEQQGTKVVLVVGDGDKVALKSIQVSERYEDSFLVVEGLQGGERVIVEGQLKARPGQTVVPTDKPVSAEPAKN